MGERRAVVIGCDIHLFIEYKLGDGPWQADKHHTTDEYGNLTDADYAHRDYGFFGVLAGVRGSGPEPKGWPDDVSEKLKSESDNWGDDGHSHSWSTLDEFKKALRKHEILKTTGIEPVAFHSQHENLSTNYTYGYSNILAYCKDQVKKFKIELEAEKHLLGQDINTEVQCRLVYFFDN